MNLEGVELRDFYGIGTFVGEEIDDTTFYYPLKVPHYQRPFKWSGSLVELLILDWYEHQESLNRLKASLSLREQHLLSKKDKYFAGSIVTVTSEKNLSKVTHSSNCAHSLIDGQQRYTTLFLINFIHFCILRNLIKIEFKRREGGKNASYLQALQKSVNFIFINNEDVHLTLTKNIKTLKDINEKINTIENYDETIEIVLNNLFLAQFKNENEYKKDYQEKMAILFSTSADLPIFNLIYDRPSYNDSLKEVLKRFYIHFDDETELSYELLKVEGQPIDKNVDRYAEAMKSILDKLVEIENNEDKESCNSYLDYIKSIQNKIEQFLKDIQVCIIQTNNTDDAYTLFEVMNDRSLALDDLDLIKNQFFKAFVENSRINNIGNLDIDEDIDYLDDQWINSIFYRNERMPDRYRALITYFSTVYITSNYSITSKKEDYREPLSLYLKGKQDDSGYLSKDIRRDFNIFQVCSNILIKLEMPINNRIEKSLLVETKLESTSFKKAFYFLNALDQEGVLSGLINLTLRAIQKLDSNFDIIKSEIFIDLIIKHQDISDKDFFKSNIIYNSCKSIFDKNELDQMIRLHSKVQLESQRLWKISMMAKGASTPREYAVELIQKNNLNSSDMIDHIKVDMENLKEQFAKLLENWRYVNKNAHVLLKIKTLFLRLLPHDINDDKVQPLKRVCLNFKDSNDAKALEIDHIIAVKGLDIRMYLKEVEAPNYSNNFRGNDYDPIHSLGNMMILPSDLNKNKSNDMVSEAIKHYEKLGIEEHHLYANLKNYTQDITIACNNSKTQNKNDEIANIIQNRTESLINWFDQLMQLE